MPLPKVAALPSSRSPFPFDPASPAAERRALLVGALPAMLQELLDKGHTERRTRFGDDGFDGMTETWSPPPGVTAQHAAAAQRALDDLAATVLAPASTDHTLGRALALLSHFPTKGLTPDVERLVALDWAEDLGEYPAWVIDAAARQWRRTRKWRPAIAEMRALCDELCVRERDLAERLRAVVRAGRQDQVHRLGERHPIPVAIKRMA